MNDRNGNPIVVGDLYVAVGEALSEFGTDKVALDMQRQLLVDDTVSGAPPTIAHVSTDLVPIASIGGGGGGVTDGDKGHVIVSGGGTVWNIDAPAVSTALSLGTAATQNVYGSGPPLGVFTALAFFATTFEVTVDFGSSINTTATGILLGTWVTALTKGVVMPCGATSDHGPEDALIEGITAVAHSPVASVGVYITAHSPLGSRGQYKFAFVGI